MQINTFVNILFINYTSNNLTYFENRLGMCILILAFYICLINPDNLCVTSISHNVKRTHCCSNKTKHSAIHFCEAKCLEI